MIKKIFIVSQNFNLIRPISIFFQIKFVHRSKAKLKSIKFALRVKMRALLALIRPLFHLFLIKIRIRNIRITKIYNPRKVKYYFRDHARLSTYHLNKGKSPESFFFTTLTLETISMSYIYVPKLLPQKKQLFSRRPWARVKLSRSGL